jgi:hypothetical protein
MVRTARSRADRCGRGAFASGAPTLKRRRFPDDGEPRVLVERADDARAKQRMVVGDHDREGTGLVLRVHCGHADSRPRPPPSSHRTTRRTKLRSVDRTTPRHRGAWVSRFTPGQ